MINDPILFISQYYRDASLINLADYTRLPAPSASTPEKTIQALALIWLSRSTLAGEQQSSLRFTHISTLAQVHVPFLYEWAVESLIINPSETGLTRALSLLTAADLRYKQQIFCAKNMRWIERATDLTSIYFNFVCTLSRSFLKKPLHEIFTPEYRLSCTTDSIRLLKQQSEHGLLDHAWLELHRPEPFLLHGGFVLPEKMFQIRRMLSHRALFSAQETQANLLSVNLQMKISKFELQIAAEPFTARRRLTFVAARDLAMHELAAARETSASMQKGLQSLNQALSDLIEKP